MCVCRCACVCMSVFWSTINLHMVSLVTCALFLALIFVAQRPQELSDIYSSMQVTARTQRCCLTAGLWRPYKPPSPGLYFVLGGGGGESNIDSIPLKKLQRKFLWQLPHRLVTVELHKCAEQRNTVFPAVRETRKPLLPLNSGHYIHDIQNALASLAIAKHKRIGLSTTQELTNWVKQSKHAHHYNYLN